MVISLTDVLLTITYNTVVYRDSEPCLHIFPTLRHGAIIDKIFSPKSTSRSLL